MKKLFTTILVLFQIVFAPLLVVAQTTGDATLRPAVLYFAPPGESTTSGNVSLNSSGNFAVDVKVNTHGSNSAGADVIVTFNTSELEFVSGTMPGAGSGTFYPTVVKGVPTNTSTVNSTGRISMARVIQAPEEGSTPTYANGDGVFANLVFKPKASNPVGTTANLNFEFTLGSTTDSNVAGTTTTNPDILGAVKNATLTIQQGGGGFNSVTISPASANLTPGGTQTFTATSDATGVTYTWSLSGSGSLSATTGSSVVYTAGSSAGSATISVSGVKDGVTKTDSSDITIGTTPPPGQEPVIDRIVPGEGDENADVEVEIYGSNFGSDEGRVYIGTRLADIISWSDSKIVVLVPQVNVSRDTEYQVKVRKADGAEARYMGYTYLDKTGLPLLPWLIMFPMNGAAALWVKKRLARKK